MAKLKCPRCGEVMTRPPAFSRTDNRTKICDSCGTEEALEEHYRGRLRPQSEWTGRADG